jgi:hypothetical protein
MEIWVVTSGRYSGYGIVGLCSTKEKADRLRETVHDGNEPFLMEVDELEHIVPVGFSGWRVDMARDGEVRNTEAWAIQVENQLGAFPYGEQCKEPSNVDNCYSFVVVAKDKQGAVKVANEKRAQLIALNAWFEGPDAFKQHLEWRKGNPNGYKIAPPTV